MLLYMYSLFCINRKLVYIMISAPQLDSILHIYKNHNLNPGSYDKNVKARINKLYKLLDLIKPLDDDEYKVLYFSVPKGNIKEYGNYKELKSSGEVKNYKEFINFFNEDYPDEIYWYKMTTSRYKNYRTIVINSSILINADLDSADELFLNKQLQEVLDFLIIKVKECIKKLKDGTYNKYINENYSYKNKFGVIKRKDYWKLYPEVKENLLKGISQEDINYFIANASDNIANRIKDMTSSKYFACVAKGYKDIGYEIGNMTNKELYLKYADGRDEGLRNIAEDSSIEFDKWYNNKKRGGGHPWEIIRGHSFARVNLQIGKDDRGYYLSLDGSVILSKIEIAKIFNVLNKNNLPIRVYNADIIKNAFKGEDDIGIVPYYIIPIMCAGYFKKYHPKEFIHIDDSKIINYIKWEPLTKVELKKEN